MTDLQKVIFEKFIEAFKANNGSLSFYQIRKENIGIGDEISHSEFRSDGDIVMRFLWDEGYIKRHYANNPWDALLTSKGWAFTSFKDLDESEKAKEASSHLELQKLKLEIDSLVNSVADYGDNKWKTNWSFYISIATTIIALAALIVSIVKQGG